MPVDIMMLGLRSVDSGLGGVETHVDHLAEKLDDRGLTVEILVRTPYAQATADTRGTRTNITKLWSPTHQSLEALVHSAVGVFYAAVKRPRILHIHAIGPCLVTPLARLFGLTVVCTHHGADYDREKWGPVARFMLRAGEFFQARFANGRICVSKSLSENLTRDFGVLFNFVPNGAHFGTPPTKWTHLKKLGLQRGKYILNVSRLVPEKRHFDLIEAFKKMDRKDLKLALVGKADHSGAYAAKLKKFADATPGVVMTGFQTGETLAELYGGAGVFALPSTHEGLPIALLEAMSYGRPVIVSDIPANLDVGLPQDCYHKVTNIDDLTHRLTATLGTGAKSGVKAVDWTEFLSDYDWDTISAKTIAVYKSANRHIHVKEVEHSAQSEESTSTISQ